MMWADPNLRDFSGRISRIERARSKGYGFEAAGTMGRSSTWKRERSAWNFVKPLMLILVISFILKGVIHHYVGNELYSERVAALMASEGFDRIGGTLMQADAVTLGISSLIAEIFPQ